MEKRALIEQFVGQREALLQACWAHQLWKKGRLKTVDGRPLAVLFPGWLNRGAGPDFIDARIQIGDQEKFGDVEVHLDEAGWRAHGHQEDEGYDRVVLHVVLRVARRGVGERNPAANVAGQIPVLDALPHLSPHLMEIMQDPTSMLKNYEQLPGRCGLRAAVAPPEALPRVVAHAAEVRARQKAERLLPLWQNRAEEQILFQQIFQALGYRPYAGIFATLAARFPLREMGGFLDLSPSRARREILARWFGALGLLDAPEPAETGEEAAREYRSWREHWRALGEAPLAEPLRRGGSRPWNSPERRLVGLFHHINSMGPGSFLGAWLGFLRRLDGVRDQPEFRKTALRLLEGAFSTPQQEVWRGRVSFFSPRMKREARLVGADRIVVVMANAVLPFFLAYARRRGDEELEKLLYRLFIVLPPEGDNQRTRFMEKRLMAFAPVPRTLRMHQGLLQIHQDFCRNFLEGCHDCGFPDLILTVE